MARSIGARLRDVAVAALAVLAVETSVASAKPGAPVAVTVEAGQAGATIERDVFGQFAEHLGAGVYGGIWVGPNSPIPNVRGIRSDVVAALRDLHVPNVRWPGGCFADEYHWRDGIGPKRRVTLNPNWGGVIESNEFGTHEFFDFAEQIGAEAYVSVNIGTGSPREAAEWFEYMTTTQPTTLEQERVANGRAAPFRVHLIGLGNESWGCGGSMTPEHYVEEMKRYARYVRNFDPAQVDQHAMRRVAVGPTDDDATYTEAVMKAWKSHDWAWNIEGISLHAYTTGGWPPSYPSDTFGESDYAKLIVATLRMNDMLSKHIAIMDRYDPEKKVGLYVDEWGVWLKNLPNTNPGFLAQQNTLRDGIIAALNLNIFARHADRVKGSNIAQMINVLQAMILTDGPKMTLTPTYHVFKMYAPFQNARIVPVSFDAGVYEKDGLKAPRLDAIAARDEKGVTWLALTNVDPNRDVSVDVAVPGLKAKGASGEVLTAARVDAHNTFDAPNAVRPRPIVGLVRGNGLRIELPAKSVAVLQLR